VRKGERVKGGKRSKGLWVGKRKEGRKDSKNSEKPFKISRTEVGESN
jgi:hypothetical protein